MAVRMKPVQIVLDQDLLARIDRQARKTGVSRSAFIRASLEKVLRAERMQGLAEQERRAYARQPPGKGEKAGLKALASSGRKVLTTVYSAHLSG